jgi:hypothetical protein
MLVNYRALSLKINSDAWVFKTEYDLIKKVHVSRTDEQNLG